MTLFWIFFRYLAQVEKALRRTGGRVMLAADMLLDKQVRCFPNDLK